MGYFSTGSEGADYEVHYCWRCLHRPHHDSPAGCPVMIAHVLHNYGQHDKAEIEELLDLFIARNERGANKRCAMWIENPDADIPGQVHLEE